MRVIILGATGMLGSGTLRECLDRAEVSHVLVLGRSSCGMHHPKLKEILHQNFLDISQIREKLHGYDACFFCLGVSAASLKKEDYERLTYSLTIHVAESLLAENPTMTFCYISGQGTDSNEKSFMHWARIKGKTENALLAMPFRAAYMFRPGYIQPVKGALTKTPIYKAFYAVLSPLYPVLSLFIPHRLTTTEHVGLAMIQAALHGAPKKILHSADINILAEKMLAVSQRR